MSRVEGQNAGADSEGASGMIEPVNLSVPRLLDSFDTDWQWNKVSSRGLDRFHKILFCDVEAATQLCFQPFFGGVFGHAFGNIRAWLL